MNFDGEDYCICEEIVAWIIGGFALITRACVGGYVMLFNE
jgi:hypothetical protein